MDENLKQIQKFCDKYNNTLVLNFNEVVILRGHTSDEMDYYWLIQDLKGNFTQTSCVGEVVALKGFISDDSYNRLKSMFQCNLDIINRKIE